MLRRLSITLVVGLLAGVLLSGCGEEEAENEAVEGEALELGELLYNVQITRFLNPSNPDDLTYLEGLEEAPPGQEYLAVFIRINNESEEPQRIASSMAVRDSRESEFEALELENPFALEFGAEIEPDGQIPEPDTAAAAGPIKGSMVLFLIDQSAAENRPLELEIPGPEGESGLIELDL